MLKKSCLMFLIMLALGAAALASSSNTIDATVDRIIQREADNMKTLENYSPLVETYIQTYLPDKALGQVPNNDYYFLGRASFKGAIRDEAFVVEQQTATHKVARDFFEFAIHHQTGVVPLGFVQMAVIDARGFNRHNYTFRFQHREFLGATPCLVFDVIPTHPSGNGRFLGRIWVEQDHYNIVRFNGTYLHPKIHTAYLHCDSWRVHVAPSLWLPAYIYSEEPAITLDTKVLAVKAQTRLWGYLASASSRQREQDSFAAVFVDPNAAVTDLAKGSLTPLESERSWERQAEDNVIERLERAELLSPPSDVDKILQQVVTNLEASSNLVVEPEVRCRVLLTSPLESFTVGHTIFVSRGLLDVLPDEASLATILAHELAHIVLSHNSNTQFAFSDRLLVEDRDTLQRLAIKRPAHEEEEADQKALELLQGTSLYKDKLGPVGLFLKQMQLSQAALPHLLRGGLAESLITTGSAARLVAAIPGVPELKAADTQQLAALPLGSRIQVNPYTDMIQMRNVSVQVLNAREKMPFQITPMYPQIAPDRLIPAVAEPAEPAAATDRSTDGGGL